MGGRRQAGGAGQVVRTVRLGEGPSFQRVRPRSPRSRHALLGRSTRRRSRFRHRGESADQPPDSIAARIVADTVTNMGEARLEPWTNLMRLDHSSTMREHRYADRFSVVRVETTGPLPDAVHKSSSVPALLVSVFVRPA